MLKIEKQISPKQNFLSNIKKTLPVFFAMSILTALKTSCDSPKIVYWLPSFIYMCYIYFFFS